MNKTSLDIVAVLTAIAGAMFAPEFAAIAGSYAAIFLGAVVGAFWAASTRPAGSSTLGTIGYAIAVILLSLAVTVPTAEVASPYINVSEPRYLFFPLATIIAGVGDRWPKLVAWAWSFIRSGIARRAGGDSSNLPPPGGSS